MTLLWAILIPLAGNKNLFLSFKHFYLPTLGLLIVHVGPLVVAFEIFVAACGI